MSPTATLVALRFRRDRTQLVLWASAIVLLTWVAPIGVAESYGTLADRTSLLQTVAANPVIMLFRGLPSGGDAAAFTQFLILPWIALLTAFLCLFLAVRHTRGDEEQGRVDLIGATTAGRTAPLLATLIEGGLAAIGVGVLVALVLVALGSDAGGSALTGAVCAAAGLLFLSVGLVTSQLMRSSRSANALGVWILLLAFLLAGIGNALGSPTPDLQRITSTWLSWVSPFGLLEQARPFADNAWAPVGIGVAIAVLLTAGAWWLHAIRDVGGSIIAARLGRAHAPRSLRSSGALAWRLTRGSLIGWGVGAILTGVMATSLSSVITQMGTQVPAVKQLLNSLSGDATIGRGMVVLFMLIGGVLASCFAVQTVVHARQEEAHGRASLVCSAAVPRLTWLWSFVVVALVGIAVIVGCLIAGAALGCLASGDFSLLGDAAVAALGQAAAASVFLAVTTLVFVFTPRLTMLLGWVLVLGALMFGLYAPLFGAPAWVEQLSPFAVTPVPAAGGVDLRGLLWLVVVTVLAGGAGLLQMRRRELTPDA